MRGQPLFALLLALAASAPATASADDAPSQDGRRTQEIIFAEIPAHSASDKPFTVAARATSGLAVALAVVSGPAVIDGPKIRLTGEPGLVIVRASQAGDSAFQPARDAERAFNVSAAPSAPAITAQPVSASVMIGESILLSVEVSGEPAPRFQWRKDGNPIEGATEAALAIPRAAPSDAGLYDVVVTNASGSATSQRARVDIGKRAQFISFMAPGGPLVAGQPVTLNASASSGLAVQFEVSSGMAFITGATLTAQAGAVVVRASQPGDSDTQAADPVTQTLVFGPPPGAVH
jgi:Immunoglobulin I-set domain